jgi:hypothetical protein
MTKATSKAAAQSKAPAPETKKEKVLALLRGEGGASLDEIVKVSGWLPHSARAVLTGFRKQGLAIEKSKANGVTRYSITAELLA